MMGTAKKSAVEKGYVAQETADKVPGGGAGTGAVPDPSAQDFPSAPKTEPAAQESPSVVKIGESEPQPA